MCVAFLLLDAHPELRLVLTFNRDEMLARPTLPSHWWADHPGVLGGRDERGGGTWLCVTRRGRLALLTNYREYASKPRADAPTRGALPLAFVESEQPPLAFLEALDARAYPSFNLLCADLRTGECAYFCSKGDAGAQPVGPGLHGLANGALDDPPHRWPKVGVGVAALRALLLQQRSDEGGRQAPGSSRGAGALVDGGATAAGASSARGGSPSVPAAAAEAAEPPGAAPEAAGAAAAKGEGLPWEALFELMSDDRQLESDPARLPPTGFGAEFEAPASAIFMPPLQTPTGDFGTRSQVALVVWRGGRAELRERYLDPADRQWREVRHEFQVEASETR